jgi:Mg2+-importing ATPase
LDLAICKVPCPTSDVFEKCDEIPFDFERRRLSIIVKGASGRMLISKGSPEGIFPLLSAYERNEKILPIDASILTEFRGTYEKFSGAGLRVLAVAYANVPVQNAYSVADEHDLTLAGFLAFGDPPRTDAAAAIADLRRDGVEVKIITGDSDLVSGTICGQVGLDAGKIVLGSELEKMSDNALGHVAEQTTVFARVSPAQKNRIIMALKHRSHVVGYMGDGINDAPSLHAADVGISVSTAVDVARDAAETRLACASRWNTRGSQGFWQCHEVFADGNQFKLWQHAQHGGGFVISTISSHASHANPAEQFSL